MALPESEVGSTANSYVILAKLATGGMAELFLARNASGAGVERYVVLKRVLKHRASDATMIQMFLDEAKLAAQLQHPNIAQVYDTGVLGDSYFFTMEYVHGETLRDILRRSHELGRPLPIEAALTTIAGAAAGLHHAHERRNLDGKPLGIVHRDVSPSNLMVSFEGTVKVVDFGVAKASLHANVTQARTVMGKIAYLSPEQCRRRQIDRRSDLFSLGIVMWELLVGDKLFKRASDYENMEAIAYQPIPAPSQSRPEVPADVEAIVMKLLAKAPNERYQTAAALLEEIEKVAVRHAMPLSAANLGRLVRDLFGQRLEPWVQMQTHDTADEVTVTAEPPAEVTVTVGAATDFESLVASVPDLSSHASIASGDELGARPRRRPGRWLAAALLGGAIAAGGVVLVTRESPGPPPAASEPASVAPEVPAAPPAVVPDAGASIDVATAAPSPAPATPAPPVKPKPERPRPRPDPAKPKPRNCDDDPLSCRR